MSQDQLVATHCCICGKKKQVWTCDQCNNDAFCDYCWDRERPHRQGAKGRGGIPHEKTDAEVVVFLRKILEASWTSEEQRLLHYNDTDTIWFGVERDATNTPSFHDYGRYAALMADTIGDHEGPRFPQLVSFIGQTGAGKSTLIKILIGHQERALHRKDQENDDMYFASPVVGSVNDNLPTTGDVHLYADPGTHSSKWPMLYADCEGLDGGDNLPLGASNDPEIVSKLKKGAQVVKRTIDWATDSETRRRSFAVSELYPRLLYTFSDTVVFVLRNSKVFESIVLEKLLKWAEASINKSINQPALPHAIIVLNATDNNIEPAQWDPTEATTKLMDDIAGAIDRVPYVQDLALRWKHHRQKVIKNTEDLLKCYYSSVTVVRIPTVGRWMLIDEQIGKLHSQIQRRCQEAKIRKEEVRMSLASDALDSFLQSAFDHFSKNLDTAFDFMKESIKNNPIPQDFGGNILKLAIAVKDHNIFFHGHEDGPAVFEKLSHLVASCIMLDYVRHETLGTGEQLLEQQYLNLCEEVLKKFCGLHWQCEFRHSKHGRCQNVQYVHNLKGHQNEYGKILGYGEYESKFRFNGYKETWKAHLRTNLKKLEKNRQLRASENQLSSIAAASEVHIELVNDFFKNFGGAYNFLSNTTCLCCLREVPEHPMPCGHVLCSPCIQDYGIRADGGMITLNACPLHEEETSQIGPVEIRIKPDHAGVRVLCLDGGGIRGIVELEILKAIERAMGGQLRIQDFFDIIVGTSTGGIITLALGAENWSVDQCADAFTRLCKTAFTARPLHALHKGKYKTRPFQKALQDAFTDRSLFGGRNDQQVKRVNVAITTTALTGRQATILTNYNRLESRNDPGYNMERAENPNDEWKIWEVARATSAAPFFYKIFSRNQRGYADGGLYYNCPVRIAYQEQRLIWSDTSTQQPDILLSLGTSHDNETATQSSKNGLGNWISKRHIGGFVGLFKHRIRNSLNCKLAWDNFWNESVASDSPDIQSRFIRLDPLFDFKQPQLDEVGALEPLRAATESHMRRQSSQRIVQDIVYRLIASTFYFQRSQDPIKDHDGDYECWGFIRCRFSNNTPEIRALGEYLFQQQASDFQPCILVKAEGLEPTISQTPLSETIISDMRGRGKFDMEPISIETSRRFPTIRICLCLKGDIRQYPPIPISGFPRNFLVEESMKKRRPRSLIQSNSGDSVRRPNRPGMNFSSGSSMDGSSTPSSSLRPIGSYSTLKSESSQEEEELEKLIPQ